MVSVPVSDYTAGTYKVPPGSGLDGVVRVGAGPVYGSGTLLATGRHVLTAAHVVDDAPVSALSVRFDLPSGPVTIPVATRHMPVVTSGLNADIAVLGLASPAPVQAGRFALYRDADEVGRTVMIAGYGMTATGPTGEIASAASAKRFGYNTVDLPTDQVVNTRPAGWWVRPGSQLAIDFDDGTAARDALGRLAGVPHVGLGAQEVLISRGDSGGPWLIDGKVAGVTSYIFRIVDRLAQPDINSRLDSSFGEMGSAQRVSHFAEWIDRTVQATLPGVPASAGQVAREVAEGNAGTRLVYFLVELSNPGPGGGSVEFRTVDGTAHAGQDYIPVAGRLVLHPGETKAVVPVEVIGDTVAEGPETFFLEAFDPKGGEFPWGHTRLRAMRTIVDDDTPGLLAATMPVGRADTAGHVGLVTSLYNAALDRAPEEAGLRFWAEHAAHGMDPVSMAANFLASGEFLARFGADPASEPERLVTHLYRSAFERDPEAEGWSHWTSLLRQGMTPAELLHALATSPEGRANAALIDNGLWYA